MNTLFLTQILQFKKNIYQKSDANPDSTVWIWSGLTQALKMKDILSLKIKDKSFIFNRLPKGQKVQMNFLGLIAFVWISLSATTISAAAVKLVNTRAEYKANPIGIDVLHPRLSWEATTDARNILQTAYEIKAALSEADLQAGKNLIWTTGKINSGQSNQVKYAGKELASGQRVFWQVRVWSNNDNGSPWSDIAFWEMGLLNASDWKAPWIEPAVNVDTGKSSPSPYLRREFELTKNVKKAQLYITSHGLYECHINGKKTGDQLLTPGWTSYNKRLQYQVYDVTASLKKGKNAIGAVLGDGWYSGYLVWKGNRNAYGKKLGLLAQLTITYDDGTQETVSTDSQWKSTTGPILESDIYNGEIYDARMELKGWDNPGYDEKNWKGVVVLNEDKKNLVASAGPPVKAIQEIKPIKILYTPQGDTVLDMGQNMVGWARIKVTGKAGTKITLRHAEVLDKKGNFYTDNLRLAKQTVQYTLKGIGEEVYEPHFTFQGFRFLAVKNFPGTLKLENITGVVVHSDMPVTGSFECSDPLINQLAHNILWGQKGNFVDVPTDCPQRDERLGWTGDAQVFAPTACYNMDVASFFTKWMRDVEADQFKDGSVPWVIPDVIKQGGATGWADVAVIIPWTIYQFYGDTGILSIQYQSMKAWVDYMQKQTGSSYIWTNGNHFGDWLAFATTNSDYPGATTDKDFIATAYFAYSTSLLHKAAAVLGKKEDAKKYETLYQNIKMAFQKEFVTSNARLSSSTQTAYLLALEFNLLTEAQQQMVAKRLADDVKKFKHLTTGFLGTPLICPVLSKYGYDSLAFMLLKRKEYPSWLYPITRGATTIWERWDGMKPDSSFQDIGMNSFNHYSYGAIGYWLFTRVAGLSLNNDAPGFKKISIHPVVGGDLTSVAAEHKSMYGKIVSGWKVEKNKFTMNVVIPPNTTAEVFIPSGTKENIFENGVAVSSVKLIKFLESKEGGQVYLVGSGSYNFEVRKN